MPMDELLSRQVPQSLEAEQSVLGSMLIDERCVPDVIALLQPDEFYLQQNRDIFETIYTMFNFSQHIDPVTVLDKMKERGVYDEAHSYDYIAQLLQITPTAANVKQYCAIGLSASSFAAAYIATGESLSSADCVTSRLSPLWMKRLFARNQIFPERLITSIPLLRNLHFAGVITLSGIQPKSRAKMAQILSSNVQSAK